MARAMEITTPLGDDVLLFHAMHAREELGRIGECRLDLLSLKSDINLDDILGKNVTIKVALQDDSTRFFNGYVTRFSQGAAYGRYRRYYATVNTWAWFMSRTSDCRIFQDMTVPEIVKKVFADHPVAMFRDELTGSYAKWNYCVQYRETDLNFVSRLMEDEGIYYYFTHEAGQHTLVMADSYSAHQGCVDAAIPFIAPEDLARQDIEHVSEWTLSREIQPGVYVQDDYDFERPSVDLRTQKTLIRGYSPADYEIFDYPGEYQIKAEGEASAAVRIEEYAAQFETAHAATNCKQITTGFLFNLDKCPRKDQNREHLIVSADYELEFSDYEAMPDRGATEYRCTFTAMSSKEQYRPPRRTPRPFVQGPQTAVVVGPAGDEIYTDKYGRVKVLFHWDREGEKKKDENCSCWIRVSHPWAGKGWGSVATPRIGQEVIVDFLEGDPDQPIITGRVYNAENQPPFGFPAGAVLSGYKSQTHKGAGSNEFSMDDTAGKERVFIHGQYNMDTVIENDQTTTVHNNRTDVIDVDDSETVGANQTIHIGANQTITIDANRDESVGGTETITITGHRSETVNGGEDVTVNGGRTHSVTGVQSTTISLAESHSVGAGRMHNVGAAEAITIGAAQVVSVGALQSVNVGGAQLVKVGGAQTVSVGGPHKLGAAAISENSKGPINIKAGATTTIEAPTIILKAGGSKIVMNSSGISIKAAKIDIKADGDVTIKAGGNINGKSGGGIKFKGPAIGEN